MKLLYKILILIMERDSLFCVHCFSVFISEKFSRKILRIKFFRFVNNNVYIIIIIYNNGKR